MLIWNKLPMCCIIVIVVGQDGEMGLIWNLRISFFCIVTWQILQDGLSAFSNADSHLLVTPTCDFQMPKCAFAPLRLSICSCEREFLGLRTVGDERGPKDCDLRQCRINSFGWFNQLIGYLNHVPWGSSCDQLPADTFVSKRLVSLI